MSTDVLLLLPIMIPLAAIALSVLSAKHLVLQRGISLLASFALLFVSLVVLDRAATGEILVSQLGSWQAPFGISFVADRFSAAMLVITAIMAVTVGLYALAWQPEQRERAMFHPLYQGLILGVVGAFLTGDIFNLYIWFEIMLISSFGLLVIDGTKEQYDAGVKYVVLNLVATSLFLLAVILLYGATGRLNLADLAVNLPNMENQGLLSTLSVLFFLAFGCKAAVFPLFFWLPAAYHTAAAPVVAIFAGLLTKVGVYALVRTYTLLFDGNPTLNAGLIGTVAGATMLLGVLGAASHYEIKRILSFHIISQIGYMLMGLAIGTPLAIAGTVLYVIHHILVKANLFLLAGWIERAAGSSHLKKIGGLYTRQPWLGVVFLIPAMSLAGIPPLSGFWAKFVVLKAGLEGGNFVLVGVALLVSALTLYSMVKIWLEAFWKDVPEQTEEALARFSQDKKSMWLGALPIVTLSALTLTIGIWLEPVLSFSTRAAEQLGDKRAYVHAVLGSEAAATAQATEVP